jgi:peptide/nickel transport system permease protein
MDAQEERPRRGVEAPRDHAESGTVWRSTRAALRNRVAAFGVAVVVALVLVALLADVIAPYDPYFQDYSAVLEAPSRRHPLGTDDIGRDQLSRIVHGARISLAVAALSVALSSSLGITLGLMSGYWGGWVDELVMRFTDALWSFPSLLLALAIAAALGRGLGPLIVALGVIGIAGMARLVRGLVLSIREMEHVTAAKAGGASGWRIVWRHVWPNVTTPVVVAASMAMATAILNEASLSFLGIGTQPPAPSWGTMLRSGYQFMDAAIWLSVFPGLAIFLAVLGLTLLGDGLQILLDPRLRRRREAGRKDSEP